MIVLNAVEERYGLKDFLKIESEVRNYIEDCIEFSKKINNK